MPRPKRPLRLFVAYMRQAECSGSPHTAQGPITVPAEILEPVTEALRGRGEEAVSPAKPSEPF
jgi:hypothetical protein